MCRCHCSIIRPGEVTSAPGAECGESRCRGRASDNTALEQVITSPGPTSISDYISHSHKYLVVMVDIVFQHLFAYVKSVAGELSSA